MMLNARLTSFVVSVLLCGVVPAGASTETSPVDQTMLKIKSYSGSGCPPGTAVAQVASDNTSVEVFYSGFRVEAGPGVDIDESAKECQLTVGLDGDSNYSFAINRSASFGYVDIDENVFGRAILSHYRQGESLGRSAWTKFEGPYQHKWQAHHEIVESSLLWSGCGHDRKDIDVKYEIKLEGTHQSPNASFMAVSPKEQGGRTTFQVVWKRC